MSWVDLAALTLVLWSAVKGYMSGVYQAFIHFCGLLTALAAAAILQKPLAFYLNGEWQVEAYFVEYLARNVNVLQKTSVSLQPGLDLPPLAGTVMLYLLPESTVLPVSTRETALTLFATMLVRFLAMTVFFFFLAAGLTYLLRLRQYGERHHKFQEWQKITGLLFGGAQGLLFSTVFCVLLDALSVISQLVFLQQDLSVAYLSRIAAQILLILPT
jgi:uncharacterized membrane protein required for colicin V production